MGGADLGGADLGAGGRMFANALLQNQLFFLQNCSP